ncbi:MAG: hypothetical protein LBK47_04605 [Prevotellaceae bacterium]|jgi:F-type H+-transporting ATPase subunit epsilon|nr:hypothetical protein [Prevotellaceae bacterium]
MKLVVITPEKTATVDGVDKVLIPGGLGDFMVLGGHAPLISTAVKGKVVYGRGGAENTIEVESGVVEVSDDVVKILVEQ